SRWHKCLKQLLHLFLGRLIQRGKIRARDLRIGDDGDLRDVVYVRVPLHCHHAHHCLAALGRKRNRHSPTQVLEVFPIIHLGLIDYEAVSILIAFSRPAWIARLIGSWSGSRCRYFKWRSKKRRCHNHALEETSVKEFHKDPDRPNHATPTVPSPIRL